MDNNPDEPEFDDDSAQLNLDQQSNGEKSITDDSNNVTKSLDQEITKEQESLEHTKRIMKESSKEFGKT